MKLLLHIGSSKTGTTSIQNFFVSNADKLLEKGILYPVKNSVAANHILLAAGFVRHNSIPIPHSRIYQENFDKYKSDFIRFKKALDKDIKNFKPKLLVLSAEQLFRDFSRVSAIQFSDFLRPYFNEIEVVAYVRDPVSDYTSRAAQQIRTGKLMRTPAVRDVRSVLEYYESQFPGCVRVNAFDREKLFDGDVVADFLTKYAPEAMDIYKASQPVVYNESLPAELLLELQEARLRIQPTGFCPKMKVLAELSRISKHFRDTHNVKTIDKLRLKPEIENYLTQSATGYLWLKDRYGITFKNLNYELIKPTEERYSDYTRLTDIAVVAEQPKTQLGFRSPVISIFSSCYGAMRYTFHWSWIRFYRMNLAYSWLGQAKRRFFS